MKHHFIEKGTMFDIEVFANDSASSVMLNGQFYNIVDNMISIKGDELYEYCSNRPAGLKLHITFYHRHNVCEFDGRFENTLTTRNGKFIEITPESNIEVKSRRTAHRHKLSTSVDLYTVKEDGTVELLCTGLTEDMSVDAIGFVSNTDIEAGVSDCFAVKFILFGNNVFKIPAKFLSKSKCPASLGYKHRYVFLFDFSTCKEENHRLAFTFFKNAAIKLGK